MDSKDDSAEEVVEEEEEEELVTMSLEEYQAQKASERSGAHFADLEVREITNEFETLTSLTKDGKTPDFMEAKFEKVFREKTSSGRKSKTTVVTDVGFRQTPVQTYRDDDGGRGRGGRGGDRGGRGGDRGGRGGRGGRGDRGRGRGRGGDRGRGAFRGRGGRGGRAPNVLDLNSFPTLG